LKTTNQKQELPVVAVTVWPNQPKLGRKHLWKVFCKDCLFRPDLSKNMATADNYCFCLVDF
jgi:fructose-specific component phosphotransferase system IIB-like protein